MTSLHAPPPHTRAASNSPVDAMMELLHHCRAEAERNASAIEALERAHSEGASRLATLESDIARTEAEVADIESRALRSAGNARANSEVLAAEQQCVPRRECLLSRAAPG